MANNEFLFVELASFGVSKLNIDWCPSAHITSVPAFSAPHLSCEFLLYIALWVISVCNIDSMLKKQA